MGKRCDCGWEGRGDDHTHDHAHDVDNVVNTITAVVIFITLVAVALRVIWGA